MAVAGVLLCVDNAQRQGSEAATEPLIQVTADSDLVRASSGWRGDWHRHPLSSSDRAFVNMAAVMLDGPSARQLAAPPGRTPGVHIPNFTGAPGVGVSEPWNPGSGIR